jgi:hypothetical protein
MKAKNYGKVAEKWFSWGKIEQREKTSDVIQADSNHKEE